MVSIMDYTTNLKVRYEDCDMYGHVNHTVYLRYMEHARIEFLKSIGEPLKKLMDEGIRLIIVRILIDYLNSAELDDELVIKTRLIKKTRVWGRFYQVITRGDEKIVEAEVKWACIGDHGRPVKIPPAIDAIEVSPLVNSYKNV